MQLFLASSFLGLAAFPRFSFSHSGCAQPSDQPSTLPPNSFPFGLPSPNSDHSHLFPPGLVAPLGAAAQRGDAANFSCPPSNFPEAAGPRVGVREWNLLCVSGGGVRWESRGSHRGCGTRLPDYRCCHGAGRRDGFFSPPDGEFYEKYASIRGGKIKHHIFGASAGGWGVARTEQQEAN